MRKILLLLLTLQGLQFVVYSQSVGINTDGSAPNTSAILDVKSTGKGVLIPRMTTGQRSAITSPATGLLVFDTDTNSFWYYNGTGWAKVETTGNNWSIAGNNGTTAGTHFIGAADAVDVVFKTSNAERMRLLSAVTSANSIATITGGDMQVNGITIGRGKGNIVSNTATGYLSLVANTTGNYNTADGSLSLAANTTGGYNTANGTQSLYSNTTGSYNTANGTQSLYTNSTGTYNTANGFLSMHTNTGGYRNTAIGTHSLYYNTNGGYNTANGAHSLYFNTTGSYNTANGSQSLYSNSTGFENTANGTYSLYSNTTGYRNTAIGYGADVATANLTNATAIGYTSIVNASNKVVIGNTAVTVIGGQVSWSTLSDGRFKSNVKEDVPGLDFILQLRPVSYRLQSKKIDAFLRQNQPDSIKKMSRPDNSEAESQLHTGFIAQEVEQVVKKNGYTFNAVHTPTNPSDNYSIAYSEFVTPLVKAVQEQQKMIDALKKQNEWLLKRIEALEKN